MLSFYREAIRFHKARPVLKDGSVIFLLGDYNVVAYARFSGTDRIAVLFNNNDEERYLDVRVWTAGFENGETVAPLLHTCWEDGAAGTWPAEQYCVTDGYLKVRMPGKSALVLGHRN